MTIHEMAEEGIFMTNVRTFKPDLKWGMGGHVCSATANTGTERMTCDLLE
jgi:hypothetical protein